MRKVIKFYVVLMFIMFIAMIVLMLFELISGAMIVCVVGMLISIVMTIPMDDIKWHMTYEQMLEDQKESARIVRNCNALIDKTKSKLFSQHIMTTEEALEILDKE